MKRIAAFLTAVLGIMTHISPIGKSWSFANWHILSTATSPFLVLIGGILGLIGVWRRDGWTAVMGLVGAFFAGRYIHNIAADHTLFEQAFGENWLETIPDEQTNNWLIDRYMIPLPPPPQLSWEKDVVIHGEGEHALLADVWQPPANIVRTGLAIIYMHGSAWHYLDKDMGTRPFFSHLVHQGQVVIDLAYTMAPKADLYHTVGDVKRAIAWAKNHAADYDIDPRKVVLVGGSAGAHIALLAAYTPNHPQLQSPDVTMDTAVAGVISYYGFADMVQSHHNLPAFSLPISAQTDKLDSLMKQWRLLPDYGRFVDPPDVIAAWLGGTPDEIPEIYELASPLNHVGAHCPPSLLVNGAYDVVMGPIQHGRLTAALQQAKIPVVHLELPYTNHGFDLMLPQWSPSYQSALYDVERFLALIGS